MSPRAACRLESLGFDRVFDYAGGKTDWMGNGFPLEGESLPPPGAGAIARPVPTCSLDDSLDDVKERAEVRAAGICIVVGEGDIVLGRLRAKELERGGRAGDVMEEGPTTVRYDEDLVGLIGRMQERKVGSIIVSAPSGRLIGLARRSDGEELIHRLHHHGHEEHSHDDR